MEINKLPKENEKETRKMTNNVSIVGSGSETFILVKPWSS
jgi:hypothetical protein